MSKIIAPLYEKVLDTDEHDVPIEYFRLYRIGNTYVLDVKINCNAPVLTITGKKELRELAKAILAEVGE